MNRSKPGQALPRLLCAIVVVLMGVFVAWGVMSPAPHGLILTLLAIAPLALPLRGLWRGSAYTAAWASLLTVPYILFGVVESMANPRARAIAGIELGVAFVLFVGLLAVARGAGRTSAPPQAAGSRGAGAADRLRSASTRLTNGTVSNRPAASASRSSESSRS